MSKDEMPVDKHVVYFSGDKWATAEVYVPANSHGVLTIKLEAAFDHVTLHDIHFDVAETLRDQLSACLKKMLKDD